MKLRNFVLVGLAIFAEFSTVFAHEYPICKDIYNNSCWSIENKSSVPVTMACSNKDGFTFSVKDFKPQEKWSYQYCEGLNDGMGIWPAPMRCKITHGDKKSTRFDFELDDYGYRVHFQVSDSQIQITRLITPKTPPKTIKSVPLQ